MSLIEYTAQVMSECPYINVSDMGVDGVSESPNTFSIDNEPITTIVKPYLNGDAMRQFTFALSSRKRTYTTKEKKDNIALYENVTRWMESVSRQRNLPAMGEGRRPQKLEALDSGYPLEMAEDNNSGIYVMQCRLTYFEKARKQ